MDVVWVEEAWYHSELETGNAGLKGAGTIISPRMLAACVVVPVVLVLLSWLTLLSLRRWNHPPDMVWGLLRWQGLPVQDPLLLPPPVVSALAGLAANNTAGHQAPTHYPRVSEHLLGLILPWALATAKVVVDTRADRLIAALQKPPLRTPTTVRRRPVFPMARRTAVQTTVA